MIDYDIVTRDLVRRSATAFSLIHSGVISNMAAKKKTTATAKKAPTKSEIYRHIDDVTGLSLKDVAAVFDSLSGLIKKNLGGRGAPGTFTMPGLLKMRVVKKPAVKARKGVNPFTGEEMMFKAKPASKVVKVAALKGLKDMV